MSILKKKHLGQHLLVDTEIKARILQVIKANIPTEQAVLEIGPGEGVLTSFLQSNYPFFKAVEIDPEACNYLINNNVILPDNLHQADCLKIDWLSLYTQQNLNVLGNFPYNISSQILFKVWEYHQNIMFVCGLFQDEVAKRISSSPGSKNFGILSVLMQTFFDIQYLFSVPPTSFDPPPAVNSAFIMFIKKKYPPCVDKPTLLALTKCLFSQRRKIIKNNLKNFPIDITIIPEIYWYKRAEQLSIEVFIMLSNLIKPPKDVPTQQN